MYVLLIVFITATLIVLVLYLNRKNPEQKKLDKLLANLPTHELSPVKPHNGPKQIPEHVFKAQWKERTKKLIDSKNFGKGFLNGELLIGLLLSESNVLPYKAPSYLDKVMNELFIELAEEYDVGNAI